MCCFSRLSAVDVFFFWFRWTKEKKYMFGFSIPYTYILQLLTHIWSMFPFYTPWKHQKTKGFPGVFRGYKMGILAKNGLNWLFFLCYIFSGFTFIFANISIKQVRSFFSEIFKLFLIFSASSCNFAQTLASLYMPDHVQLKALTHIYSYL